MNENDEAACRSLAASSVVGMPIRAAIEELDALRAAVKPFARLVSQTDGRIPTERLSFADWHALAKAAAMAKNDVANQTAKHKPGRDAHAIMAEYCAP